MALIILDFGSGNTCKNKKCYIKEMFNNLRGIDERKHEVIVKFQLFQNAWENIPLRHDIFEYAHEYGKYLGYKVTASINSVKDLEFLLRFDIPFVKIKNDRNLDFLIDFIEPKIPVYISSNSNKIACERNVNIEKFFCVSNYPAIITDYERLELFQGCNISDHTDNFELFKKYNPKIIEWHYKLSYSTGLDSGSFARTPEQLKEILSN